MSLQQVYYTVLLNGGEPRETFRLMTRQGITKVVELLELQGLN